MTTETRISRKEIESLSIKDIVDDDRVKNRFVELYNSRSKTTEGLAQFIRATESFMRVLSEDQNLQKCTTLSLYNAFMDMGYFGIDVAKQTKPLAYLLWNNVNVGTKQKPVYEKRANLEISPYGELAIRQAMGQIKAADDPIIVYEHDDYSGVYYKDGRKMVDYKRDKDRKSNKIVAAFIKIIRLDGTEDFKEIDMNRMAKLAKYSETKNKRNNPNGQANKLYSSNNGQPDEGFLIAKLIKHAFSSYPKVSNPNLNTKFVTEIEPEEAGTAEDIYGVEDAEEVTPEVEDTEHEEIKPDDSF